MKVKIIGAGSIGNHLAQASRRMGWDVVVIDKDSEALRRMKEDIYPTRYGSWDESIQLFTSDKEPMGDFDIICIGTPPDTHIALALKALEENPKLLQIEKPLCTPFLEGLDEFLAKLKNQPETKVIVGYDNVLLPSVQFVAKLLTGSEKIDIGEILTIDVEFREHWAGIFKAHPWLGGPNDSYLGFWRRGGGASGEHSHALHMWQYFANLLADSFGRLKRFSATMDMVEKNDFEYDAITLFNLKTESGRVGRVVQDVITSPTKKWARIQGEKGFIEWIGNGHSKGDVVKWETELGQSSKIFKKTRPDDFFCEIKHMQGILDGDISAEHSSVSIQSGIDVMTVLKLAHTHRNKGMVDIN